MIRRFWWLLLNITLFLFVFNALQVNGDDLPSVLKITIPDYEVSKIADFDYVNIPSGHILLVDGKPMVPYYSVSVDYPRGYRVQNVVERKRGELVTDTGLKLPIVTMQNRSSSTNEPLSNGDWYPKEDYHWSILMSPDGTTTLTIIMYPFHYNSKTTEVKFYIQYEFDVAYIFSTVSILDMSTEKPVYDPEEGVIINVLINNSDEAKDILPAL
jgi:hypothetical protein